MQDSCSRALKIKRELHGDVKSGNSGTRGQVDRRTVVILSKMNERDILIELNFRVPFLAGHETPFRFHPVALAGKRFNQIFSRV